MSFGTYRIQAMLDFCTDSNFSLSHFLHLDHRDLCNSCLDPPHLSVYGFKPNPKSIYTEIFNINGVSTVHIIVFPLTFGISFVCQKLL